VYDYAPQNTNDAKTKSRDYFNNHRRSRLAGGGYWRHDYKYAFSIIKKIKPENLIDIGCGPGAFLSEVSRLFPDVQLNALDLSEEMIEETRNRLSGKVIATVGDSENMPLEDEQYQVVTCNMSIHHYPHPQKAVNEMYRILKNGGYLLLNDMDCASPIRAALPNLSENIHWHPADPIATVDIRRSENNNLLTTNPSTDNIVIGN
jgi:ubiquinone/menaquinone biosynthesis C-methylase UbiE